MSASVAERPSATVDATFLIALSGVLADLIAGGGASWGMDRVVSSYERIIAQDETTGAFAYYSHEDGR